MPYNKESVINHSDVTTGAYTAPLPSHATGDMLFVLIVRDGNNASAVTTTETGWVELPFADNTQSSYICLWYKFATSSNETNPEFTSGVNVHWYSNAVTIGDAVSVNIHDSSNLNTGFGSHPYPSVTSTSNDNLIIYGFGCNDETIMLPNYTASQSLAVATTVPEFLTLNLNGELYLDYQETAGLVDSFESFSFKDTIRGILFTVVIEGNGSLTKPLGINEAPVEYICMGEESVLDVLGGTWNNDPSNDLPTLNGITVTQDDLTTQAQGGSISEYIPSLYMTPPNDTASFYGNKYVFNASKDLSNQLVSVSLNVRSIGGKNRIASCADGGLVVVFHEGPRWRAYPVGGYDAPYINEREWFDAIINPDRVDTILEESGIAIDTTLIDGISILTKARFPLATEIGCGAICVLNKVSVTGGVNTLTFDDYIDVLKRSTGKELITKNSSAPQYVSQISIELSGNDYNLDDTALYFSNEYDLANCITNVHITPGQLNLSIDMPSGSSLTWVNGFIESEVSVGFNSVDNGSFSSFDVTGLKLVNTYQPTIAPVGSWNDVTFKSTNGKIDLTGVALDGLKVDSSVDTAIVIDSSTSLDNSLLSNNPIAIEIVEEGTYIFSGVTLTNNVTEVQVTADLPNVEDIVTINSAGQGIDLDDQHTGLGSVVVSNDAILTVTNLPAGKDAVFGYWPTSGNRMIDLQTASVANDTETEIQIPLPGGEYYWSADAVDYRRPADGIINVAGNTTLLVTLERIQSSDGSAILPDSLTPEKQLIADKFVWNLADPMNPYIEIIHAAGGTWRFSQNDFDALAYKIDTLQSQGFALVFENTLSLAPSEIIFGQTNSLKVRQDPTNPVGTIIDLREITVRREGTVLDDFIDHGTNNAFPVLINTTTPICVDTLNLTLDDGEIARRKDVRNVMAVISGK